MLKEIEQPILTVQVEVAMCVFDIRFNDVPILTDPEGLPVNVEIPVNHWAVSGENRLSLTLSPHPDKPGLDPDAECLLQLFARKNQAPRKLRKEIAKLGWPKPGAGLPQEKDEIKIGPAEVDQSPAGVTMSRTIQMPLDLPAWAWLEGETIEEGPETQAVLTDEYRKLWGALDAGDAPAALQLASLKIDELAAAFYLSREEVEDELEYQNLIDDAEVSLWPFKPEQTSLQVFGDGRLARLSRLDGNSPIVFVCNDESAAHYLDIIFCKRPDGWTVAR